MTTLSKQLEKTFEELIELQRKKLRDIARELGIRASGDDLLSPYDFPQLNQSSRFHFEDGILAGLLSAQMALRRVLDGNLDETQRGG